MPVPLPSHPTLPDYQRYLAQVVKDRGFENETVPDLFLLFLEECGELAKSVRKTVGLKSGSHSKEYNPAHEAADVFIYLVEICSAIGIDLETAVREKEEINKSRQNNLHHHLR